MIHSVIPEKRIGFIGHVKTWKDAERLQGHTSIAFHFEIIHLSGYYTGGFCDLKDSKHLLMLY